MTKKKSAETEPKFTVRKREKKTLQAFENLTPFRHPLADVFEFPSSASDPVTSEPSLTSQNLTRATPISESTPASETSGSTPTSIYEPPIIGDLPDKDDLVNKTVEDLEITIENPNDPNQILTGATPTRLTTPSRETSLTSEFSPKLSNPVHAVNFVNNPISPVRDFQKVANSITRDAIPAGLFKPGKCKELYDTLYHLTRGAIKPKRSVRISKPQLQKLSGIGTKVTLVTNLRHLESVGLIVINTLIGEHGGNEYTVYLPEEIDLTSGDTPSSRTSPTTPTSPSSPPNPSQSYYTDQEVDSLVRLESSRTRPGIEAVNIGIKQAPKTFIKTNKESDDEPSAAFSEMNKTLEEAVKKLTGKGTTAADKERWNNVANILTTQLEIIASRTPISNAPAILAEHLHRLLNSRKAQDQLGLITPAEARTLKEKDEQIDKNTLQETSKDAYLCPDCYGSGFHNPDGKGRRPGCQHPRLEEARARASENGEI